MFSWSMLAGFKICDMKTKQELEALHRLFMSEDSSNWELGAMMCSLEDFEKILRIEERRMLNTDDFAVSYWSFINMEDEHAGRCVEYGMQLLFDYDLEFKVSSGVSGLRIDRHWGDNEGEVVTWSFFKYVSNSDSFTFWLDGSMHSESPRNQYLTTDFESELEAVKEYWREQFLTIKNNQQ